MRQPQYIYHLIDEGYANKHTVAKLINQQDKTALQRYLDECRRRRDNALLLAEKEQAQNMQAAMCRRWVNEAMEKAGGDIEQAKARIAKLKQFCEDFELVDAMRRAWIDVILKC
jgi:hypothetical protein